MEFAQLVSRLALGITVKWMNLKRDFKLWTFNIVETAIDYEDFGSWIKYIFYHMLWVGLAAIDSCV